MTARAIVAGLVMTIGMSIPGPAAAGDGVAQEVARARWRDGGVVTTTVPGRFMSDASTSGVFVGVGVAGAVSTLARRAADGTWRRVGARIGSPVGVDVNDSGDAFVLSVRSSGALLSTSWLHGARLPHTGVILPAGAAPKSPRAELVANGRGDLAALVRPGAGGGPSVLLRKPLRKVWSRPVTIRPGRYDGVLDSIDVGNGGLVEGAFRRGASLTARALQTGTSTFGPPRRLATWREPGRHPAATQVRAEIAVGRNGGIASLWSYRLNERWVSLLDVLPTGSRRFEARIAKGGAHDLAAVGDDGSVLLSGGLRWNPHTRHLVNGSTLALLDADSRGDALMGAASRRGDLALWPIGGPQQRRVAAPPGRRVDAVLTTEGVVFLAVATSHRLVLRIRQF